MKLNTLKTFALSAVAIAAMTGCGDTTITYGDSTVIIGTIPDTPPSDGTPEVVLDLLTKASSLPVEELVGTYQEDMILTNDKLWLLTELVIFQRDPNSPNTPVTLTIQPGTVIAGKEGDGDAASWMVIDKNVQIDADGTAEEPIVFTSKIRVDSPTTNTVAQWGGLTIIGNAIMDGQVTQYEVPVEPPFVPGTLIEDDDSGVLRHVYILNTGKGVGTGETEINGLSMVGVGNGTLMDNITVDYSGDDGIEIWGGTVNLSNITISNCTDDHLDVDDGYSGTVSNFTINGSSVGYAGIEMSGKTAAHFENFTINIPNQEKEGGIFFKGTDGIGGHFLNGEINYDTNISGAIYSDSLADMPNISFQDVTINALPGSAFFNKDDNDAYSADDIEDTFFFDGNTDGNVVNEI